MIYSKNTDESLDECRRMQTGNQMSVDKCRRVQTNVDKCRRVIRQLLTNVLAQTSHQTSEDKCRQVQTNQKFEKVARGTILLLLQVCKSRLHMYANFQFCSFICDYTQFFYKQPVYKQLALTWQIPKQLSAISPLLLSNNKNYRLKKSGVFPL